MPEWNPAWAGPFCRCPQPMKCTRNRENSFLRNELPRKWGLKQESIMQPCFFRIKYLIFLCLRWDGRRREGKPTDLELLVCKHTKGLSILFLEGLGANIPTGWSSAWNEYFLMNLENESPERLQTHLECSKLGVLAKAYQRLPAQAQ